jgi:hypothetical protein
MEITPPELLSDANLGEISKFIDTAKRKFSAKTDIVKRSKV